MKIKGECISRSVVGRVSGVVNGRAREGVALLLSKRVLEGVVEYREVSARLMWERLNLEASFGCLLVPTIQGVRKKGRPFGVS